MTSENELCLCGKPLVERAIDGQPFLYCASCGMHVGWPDARTSEAAIARWREARRAVSASEKQVPAADGVITEIRATGETRGHLTSNFRLVQAVGAEAFLFAETDEIGFRFTAENGNSIAITVPAALFWNMYANMAEIGELLDADESYDKQAGA